MNIDLGQMVKDGIVEGFLLTAQIFGNVALENIEYIVAGVVVIAGLRIGGNRLRQVVNG